MSTTWAAGRPPSRLALNITAASLGVTWLVLAAIVWRSDAPTRPDVRRTAASDDEYGFDCRIAGNRTCGSDVTWQAPGVYPAPDGGTYTVVLVTPYMACLAAGNIPGPSGFAAKVCEPLRAAEPNEVR